MGDRLNNLQRVPLNVVNKILKEALVESGWSPLSRRKVVPHSPHSRTMDAIQEELNGNLKITVNNNYITNKWNGSFPAEQRSVTLDMADTSIQSYFSEPVFGTHPTSGLSKKSMGEKRKEKWLQKQADKTINNNYIHDLSSVSPLLSPSPGSPAFSPDNKTSEIPEDIRRLIKQCLEETMPLIILDGLEPSATCTCERPAATIMCRMCGAQFEGKCFLHQAVGNNGYQVPRCSRPACYSDKLIQLRNV